MCVCVCIMHEERERAKIHLWMKELKRNNNEEIFMCFLEWNPIYYAIISTYPMCINLKCIPIIIYYFKLPPLTDCASFWVRQMYWIEPNVECSLFIHRLFSPFAQFNSFSVVLFYYKYWDYSHASVCMHAFK